MRTIQLRWWNVVVGLSVATGCATDEPDLASQDQAVNVMWTNAVGVTVAGNSLTKTAPVGWGNAGASSTFNVTGDAVIDFTTAENNKGKSVGLSIGDQNQDYTDIDWSIHLSGNGTIYVYEAGLLMGNFGAYAATDTFRVQALEREVTYRRNGAVFYTSTRAAMYPLLADTALYHVGSTINGAAGGEFTFDHVVAANPAGAMITKAAPDGWGNSGAISTRTIKAGDGYVEFSTSENNKGKIVGLSLVDTNQSYTSVKWGILLGANTAIQIYESGVLKGTFGTYVANDVFRVQFVGTQVQYTKNGTVFATSAVAPSYPAFADIALFSNNATVKNLLVDDTFWTQVIGAEAIGNKLVGTAATGWGNSGATTIDSIAAGTGYIEFGTRENNISKAAGLTTASMNANYSDINYAIALGAGGGVTVYELGVPRGSFGSYTAADVFRVEVNAGGMVEYKKNGTVFYTSTVAPVYPLFGDAAVFSAGGTISGVTLLDTP